MIDLIVQTRTEMEIARYLSRAFPLCDFRAAFKRRDVKLNGRRASRDDKVVSGDRITAYVTPDMSIELIGPFSGLVAAVKPQGLPVDEEENGIAVDTALNRVRAVYPAAELCHRLDAVTGGVLLFSLDDKAHSRALAAFKDHAVTKRYKAVCAGGFEKSEYLYSDKLIKDSRASRVRIVKSGAGSVECVTRVRVLRDNGSFAFVELEPVTGRTHQLRAHLAYKGHPILGDDKYGSRQLNREYATTLKLWCEYIALDGAEFYHPAPFDDFVNRLHI